MNLRRFAGQAALFIAAVSFKAHAQPPVPIQNVPDPSKLTASQALEVEVVEVHNGWAVPSTIQRHDGKFILLLVNRTGNSKESFSVAPTAASSSGSDTNASPSPEPSDPSVGAGSSDTTTDTTTAPAADSTTSATPSAPSSDSTAGTSSTSGTTTPGPGGSGPSTAVLTLSDQFAPAARHRMAGLVSLSKGEYDVTQITTGKIVCHIEIN